MSLKSDLQKYQQRWKHIDQYLEAEQRSKSMELRWRQMNAACGLAKGLDLMRPDPSEYEVYAIWAKIKDKTLNQPKKI